jgi:cysteine desulfuration protein SufE
MNSIQKKQSELVTEFKQFLLWEDRYKHLIEIGKTVPALEKAFYDDKYLVKGCQSRVWLHASLNQAGNVVYVADSEALIVKGLVAILLKVYSQESPDDILQNPPQFIQDLGFQSHLSPSRANGLMSMVKQMMMYATAFKALGLKTEIK